MSIPDFGQTITVTFTFRVSDEQVLRDVAEDVLKDPAYDGVLDAQTAALDDLAEVIIAEKVGGWLGIGLERVDD